MIKFFRKIRYNLMSDNKTGKYLKYAIGEIMLVMVGILLALQVNNWNEERKEANRMNYYAKALIQDLKRDLKMIEVIKLQTNIIVQRIDSLANYVNSRKFEELSNTDMFILMEASLYRPYKWSRSTLDDLKNSGNLNLVKNDSLKILLSAYDAESRHLDEDYNSDKVQSENASILMGEVVDFNSPFFNEFMDAQINSGNGIVDVNGFEMPNYDQSKSKDLTLLAMDKGMVKKAVNSYLLIQKDMKIRGTKELPRIETYAREIIETLKKEYD